MPQLHVHESNGPVTLVTHRRIFPMKPSPVLIRSSDGPLPQRKRKPKPDPLIDFEPYLALRAAVLNGKFRPMEEKGIFVRPQDAAKLGLRWPWRVVADRLRHAIKAAGLDGDFHVIKYETDTPGVWFVKVRYEPPMVKAKGGSRD